MHVAVVLGCMYSSALGGPFLFAKTGIKFINYIMRRTMKHHEVS